MANRSYLYSLSNRPTSYSDRPETISGLSEWAYQVPFSYRVLLSGDTQICSSLVSDGFDDEPKDKKSKLYAISGDFDSGYARMQRFAAVVNHLASGSAPDLLEFLEETLEFLASRRDGYLLLETIELDMMTATGEAEFRACVESEIDRCIRAGAAVDALPENLNDAAKCLQEATQKVCEYPLDAFNGLRLDDDCDNTFNEMTQYPLGLEWSEVLYYDLWNRSKFEATQ